MTYKTLSYFFGIYFTQTVVYCFALLYVINCAFSAWFLMLLFCSYFTIFGLNCRRNMQSITFSVPLCIQVSRQTLDTTMRTSRSLSTTFNIRYS